MTDTNRNPESKHTSMCTWKSPCEPEKEEEEAAGTALEKVEERTESAIATKKNATPITANPKILTKKC
jgi:hypothetical protein